MKIAVLMSTYNGHKYLNQQLKSLANQTIANNMTVYIRDDGSTDNTFEIIETWQKKMRIVLYKESNAGPAMSFWKLFMKPEIQADYYAFCDQDDVWDADKIEIAIKRLNEDTHFYACNCRIIDENETVVDETRCKEAPRISMKSLFVSGVTQGCSMVFDNTLRQYIMDQRLECIPMHDVVLMLYALVFGKIYFDQEPHFSYRVHSNNVVAKSNKSLFKRIKTTWWNWRNSNKNSMSKVASELMNNSNELTKDDEEFLESIADYKRHKIKVCHACGKEGVERKALRSFRVRVLLGLY